jgi:DNA primase
MAFGVIKNYLDQLTPIIRDAYVPHGATVLGISSALFGNIELIKEEGEKKRPKKNRQPTVSVSETKEDIGKLSIIKTLYENREFIDEVINVIESSMFGDYAMLLDAVLKNEKNNSNLIGLTLDENIKTMQKEELEKSLISLLFGHYTTQLKAISTSSIMPLNKKSFLIRKIKMDIMPRLKGGELVSYQIK